MKRYVIVGALVLAALAGWQFWESHHQDKKADADVTKSVVVDAQHKAQTDSSAKIDKQVAVIENTRKSALDEANRIHTVADTMGQNAKTVRDSLNMWHSRDSAHVAENDSLRAVIRSDSLQKILLANKAAGWKSVADSAVPAMDALRKDLAVARSGCRIIPFVKCLSRKQSMVVGLVIGAVAYAEKDRLSHHGR